MGAYVEIPRPFETALGRFMTELVFPVQSKRRAEQHHGVAWALADVHGLEMSTPYKVNPRWSVYEERWGNGERHGWLDVRRLRVEGSARAVARYLVVLERVLEEIEALATRAARVFGQWRRSVAAEPFVEYEDACTLRVRGREFRADVLRCLVQRVAGRGPAVGARDGSVPLWEQYEAVAGEVWAAAGGVDVEAVDERAVTARLLAMLAGSEAGRAVAAEAEHLVCEEARRAGRGAEAVSGRPPGRGGARQAELFAYEELGRSPGGVTAGRPDRFDSRRYATAA